MQIVTGFLEFLWHSGLMLAPVLLVGLFLSGLFHVFISRDAVLRWLRKDNLNSVSAAAAIGMPLPLCSCSVVPVVAEMRNKGASRSSCMSFLITTPETGADSILITSVFFGWIGAITRPLISFVTAISAGIAAIKFLKPEQPITETEQKKKMTCCNKSGHHYLVPQNLDCHIGLKELRNAIVNVFTRKNTTSLPQGPTLGQIAKHIFRYGFVDMADDILTALLIGLFLGGLLFLVVPQELMHSEYARWLSYPVLLIVGVPLYICASASTPIAAALVAKGCSPGAALIFLMTGPATNTTTIAMIMKQFGSRFSSIYVGSVVLVTIACGICVDVLILSVGFELVVNLEPSENHAVQITSYVCLALFLVLLIWRALDGALKRGWDEMVSNVRPLLTRRTHT